MKLEEIVLSQAIRLLKTTSPKTGNLYGSKLFRFFEERYGFLQGPRTVSEYDPNKGIVFLHGYFDDRVVIDRCAIFNDGIVCETKAAVEQADLFIDDVLGWAASEFGIETEQTVARVYLSQIVVRSEKKIQKSLNLFGNFGAHLSEVTKSYGLNSVEFQAAGIRFSPDSAILPQPKPTGFILERRDGQPFESGLYYSSAPLRTDDHLKCLERLEELLAD